MPTETQRRRPPKARRSAPAGQPGSAMSPPLLLPVNTLLDGAATGPGLAPLIEQDTALSPAQVARFRQQGFLVVPQACDRSEQREIRRQLLDLFERRVGRAEGKQFDMLGLDRNRHGSLQPQIINPGLFAPALLHSRYFQRVERMARQLLGRDCAFSFDHSILKRAGSAAATPWHQDEAHHPDPHFHHEQISFWLPLQDVSIHNGCMSYVPGSHLGALLPHRSLGDDPRVHAIECSSEYFDLRRARPQPVSAGTCVMHAGRTLHTALPNHSDADRLVYVLAFRGPLTPRPEPECFPWLEAKRTASTERNRRWRLRGGALVLIARRLRRLLKLDLRRMQAKLAELRHRLHLRLRGLARRGARPPGL